MLSLVSPTARDCPDPSDLPNSPRKRRKLSPDNDREPLRNITNSSHAESKTVAGFLVDEDSDEEELLKYSRHSSSKLARDIKTTSQLYGPSEAILVDSGIATPTGPGPDGTQTASQERVEERQERSSRDNDGNLCPTFKDFPRYTFEVRACSGQVLRVARRVRKTHVHYERLAASKSVTETNRAQKSYYGIDIHTLVNQANETLVQISKNREEEIEDDIAGPIDTTEEAHKSLTNNAKTLLWTEKYRARKFTDLVGDERTHRQVLRWLKGWDDIVFPGQYKPKAKYQALQEDADNVRQRRKVMLLTGPPGLGKTTLAHVCAKQAGYEVQEINASDERSRDVVKGRIRDMVGTENVRPMDQSVKGGTRKVARPVCVIVDEVDGVVGGGTGAGEGGFVKALVDLLALDQKNTASKALGTTNSNNKKKKGDSFRMMRPLVLICNDVYHPSLRLLRQGTIAEIVYVRKPALNMVIPRLRSIFEQEGVPCDSDGVRQLCEAAWGVSKRRDNPRGVGGTAEGDMRSILVIGEWTAARLRASVPTKGQELKLTRDWIEKNVIGDLAHGGGAARNLGRGGSRETSERVFLHNAGFVASTRSALQKQEDHSILAGSVMPEPGKKYTMDRLQEMVMSSGETDRIMTDCFTAFPTHPFQDDTILTKPMLAYDWLHFHSSISHLVHTGQEWDLAAYLSYPALAFHQLFAAPTSYSSASMSHNRGNNEDESEPIARLSGPKADHTAFEIQRANQSTLSSLHTALSMSLQRSFNGTDELATDLIPLVLRILNPDVKPVVIGGSASNASVASVRRDSEKALVVRGVQAMLACGIQFDRSRVDGPDLADVRTAITRNSGWIFRMEPPLDEMGIYETRVSTSDDVVTTATKVRYAVRQVLEQEYKREVKAREQDARVRRGKGQGTALGFEDVDDAVLETSTICRSKEGNVTMNSIEQHQKRPKRDFFGRLLAPLTAEQVAKADIDRSNNKWNADSRNDDKDRVYIVYHEGYSNAVKKPITLKELMDGL